MVSFAVAVLLLLRAAQWGRPCLSPAAWSSLGKSSLMRRYIEILISLVFLGYGLIRLGVGSALLGQELGLFDFQAFREPMADIGRFLEASNDRQIIHVSVAGYVGYIALMGAVLSIGAVRSLKNLPFGLSFIGAFLAMYALLFINFQTINPKALHLAVSVLLFGALFWMKGTYRSHRGAYTGR